MAMILDAFVGRYIGKLSEVIDGEISMMLGIKDELKKLRERTESIEAFLESAERRRHTERTIGIWVKKLKDVMYDADDIIDLCMIEGRKLLEDRPSESAVRHHFSLFSCFRCITFRHEIGSKIRKLNNRLNMIIEDQSKLPKLEPTGQDVRVGGVNHRQTSPEDVVKSDIVGTQIEDATQSLVESLIKEDNKKYQVQGIVGMGGIGKTTLASNIYNHESIINIFPIRVWLCVSEDFLDIKLLKNIIRGAKGEYKEDETKAELKSNLSSILSKRYFIVLDDVWTTDVWEDLLRSSLENATASGRIVVTTRYMNVVRSMKAHKNTEADIHRVQKMDNDSGWEMLRKKIFRDDDDEQEISNLKEIGDKIIEKCDGLPLAIKTIAGVLSSKERTNMEWKKVLKSDAWSMGQLDAELPGALFLSYEDLSSDLKQCFLYFSLFPEDYVMDRDDLIRYWVAEGFVKDNLMEDLAEDFYRELIGRNLLEPCDEDGDLSDLVGNYCKMHDLLRSLARFLIRDESIFLGDEQSPNTNLLSKLRRLSMVNRGERLEVPDVIKQQKCLRTLLVWRGSGIKMVENELFENLRFLRVMNLSRTRLESLPDSVGDLLHLRYLNVSGTNIKELPESIGCLVNLQVLNLAYCTSLHALPKAITKLCNLRCLCLKETLLTHVPKGIGKLKHLNHLEGFVIGHDDRRHAGCDLKELQFLSQLRFLEINRLERIEPAGAPVLANSRSLRTLILECGLFGLEEEAIAIERIDKIYNIDLSPRSTHLQRLEINEFFGTGFPGWMMSPSLDVSFPNLTNIRLFYCKSCPQVPPLDLLPQLKSLRIEKASAIKTMGPEFLGPRASSAATSFPKLEELYFVEMFNLEEWSFGMVEGVGEERRGAPKLLPRLIRLTLNVCPKLRALPPLGLLPQLKYLEIRYAGAIETVGPEFLGPRASSAATSFPKLEELHFEDMENWKEWSFGMVEGGGEGRRGAPNLLPHLMKLKLAYCPKLRALPQGLRHDTNLQELNITTLYDLKEISNLPSLKSLQISFCPMLEHVENLDKLQYLRVELPGSTRISTVDADGQRERLPRWLLELLQNAPAAMHNLQKFDLLCNLPLLKTFLKDGPNWPIIQPIHQVEIRRYDSYIRYTKDLPHETHIKEESEEELEEPEESSENY
ncbi:putative disease resistance protein RGA1 [Cocos nucifera]|nr:putative disease resistance protein RGA1 [Cocos nucifera]